MADHLDERTPGFEAPLRVAGWGTATAVALGLFAYTAQSDGGSERLQVALGGTLGETGHVAVASVDKPDPQVKALQAKFDRLDTERLRIDARLTTLEHGLDDVTGSIKRQTDARGPVQGPAARPFIEPPIIPSVETLPRGITAPKLAAVSSIAPDPAPAAQPEPVAAAIPVPPPRPHLHHSARHTEYGVQLGIAPDMEALRAGWTTVKANYGPLLVGLSPVGVKEAKNGSEQVLLVAGPLKNLTAARELCVHVTAAKGYCRPMRVNETDVVLR